MNFIAVSQSAAPKDVVAGLCVIELGSLAQEADSTSEKTKQKTNQIQDQKTKTSQNTTMLNVKLGFTNLVRLFSESEKINRLLAQCM